MPSNNSNKADQPKQQPQRRRRARQGDGTYKGDNPASPDLNEAWEPTPVEAALPKEVDYSVKQKISGTSEPTAGKYGKKPKVRPTFGNVTTNFH